MTSTNQNYYDKRGQTDALPYALLLTAVMATTCFVLNKFDFPNNPNILPAHVETLGMQSTQNQKSIYVLTVITLAMTCILTMRGSIQFDFLQKRNLNNLAIIGLLLPLMLLSEWHEKNYSALSAALIALTFLNYPNASNPTGQLEQLLHKTIHHWKIASVALAALVLLIWVIPIFSPLRIETLKELVRIDIHYAVTVLSGYDLANTKEASTLRNANYGFGMPLLTAIYLGVLAPLGDHITSLPNVVKFYQLIAVGLISLVLILRSKRLWIQGTLIAIIPTAYTLSNLGAGVSFPNHSGIRFVPLLFGLIIYAYELKRKQIRYWLLASTSAFVTLLNVETGLPLVVACLATAFYSSLSETASLLTAIHKCALILGCFGLCFVGLAAITIPMLANVNHFSEFLSLFGASGFGGMRNKLSFSAAIITLTGMYTLLDAASKSRLGKIDHHDLWEVLLATTMLVWLTYYVNRMDEWNLWFEWVLITFWSISKLDRHLCSPNSNHSNPGEHYGPNEKLLYCLVAGALIGQAYGSISYLGYRVSREIAYSKSKRTERDYSFVGFSIVGRDGRYVKKYFEELKSLDASNTMVFSNLPTLTRLHGFNALSPYYTPFEILTFSDLPKAKALISGTEDQVIAFDSPRSELGMLKPQLGTQLQSIFGKKALGQAYISGEWSQISKGDLFSDEP